MAYLSREQVIGQRLNWFRKTQVLGSAANAPVNSAAPAFLRTAQRGRGEIC